MEGVEKIDEFEFLDFDLSAVGEDGDEDRYAEPYIEKDKRENDEESEGEEEPAERRKRVNPMGLGFTAEAAEGEDDYINSSQIQAYTYGHSFVASGSVIKVYEPVDEQDLERKSAIKYSFQINNIKNADGEAVHPMNMMLHRGENRMIFSDANDASQLFDYDLEAGQVVEQFQATADSTYAPLTHLSATVRNGQVSEDPLLVGVGSRAIFTMDTRINSKIKKA